MISNPCCPIINSLKRLNNPTQITGDTSTPPIGGTIFLVKESIDSVGSTISIQNPLFESTFGYQVRIILKRNNNIKIVKPTFRLKLVIVRRLVEIEITKIEAS